MKRWTSGFYSTPQVDELPDRNSENKGTKSQCLHTFLQYFKLQTEAEVLYRKFYHSLQEKQSKINKDSKPEEPKAVVGFVQLLGFHSGPRRENSYIYIIKRGSNQGGFFIFL